MHDYALTIKRSYPIYRLPRISMIQYLYKTCSRALYTPLDSSKWFGSQMHVVIYDSVADLSGAKVVRTMAYAATVAMSLEIDLKGSADNHNSTSSTQH